VPTHVIDARQILRGDRIIDGVPALQDHTISDLSYSGSHIVVTGVRRTTLRLPGRQRVTVLRWNAQRIHQNAAINRQYLTEHSASPAERANAVRALHRRGYGPDGYGRYYDGPKNTGR
jgi:hypothetical protein